MNLINKTAYELARDNTPDDLRAEAYWIVWADGTRGSQWVYGGQEHGMHWWDTPSGRLRLKSRPAPMSQEERDKLDASMRRHFERERERMLGVGILR